MEIARAPSGIDGSGGTQANPDGGDAALNADADNATDLGNPDIVAPRLTPAECRQAGPNSTTCR